MGSICLYLPQRIRSKYSKDMIYSVVVSNIVNFHGNDPIWLFSSKGCWNHQLVYHNRGILGAFVYSPLATWRTWLRSHDVTIVNFWSKSFFRSICPKILLQIVSVQPMDHPSTLLLFFVFAVCFTFFLTGVDHMFREVVLDCQSFPWFSPQNIVRFCIVFPIILLFLVVGFMSSARRVLWCTWNHS